MNKLVIEDDLLANLFLNLKGSKIKRDDWISIAKVCRDVVKKSKTKQEAAKKLGVSTELIRSLLSLLNLPKEVQELIKKDQILFDAAQRLNTIKLPDKEAQKAKQIEVANTIAGLTSHEQREIISFAKKFPKSSLKNYKKRVTQPREIKNLHVIVIALEEDYYVSLHKVARKEGLSVEKMALKIINERVGAHKN